MTLHEIHDKYNYFLAETHLANGERADLTTVVRNGMVMLIPVLLIGAFALNVRFFPIGAYQIFIRSFAGGFIDTLFEYISNASFGLMSVLMTFTISYCYLTQYDDGKLNVIAGVMTSLICFYILIGGFTSNFQPNLLGSQGVASAIICGIFAAHIYRLVYGIKLFNKHIFSDGSDFIFNSMIFSTLPACITIVLFALCNLIIIKMFRVNCFHDIFVGIGTWVFGGMGVHVLAAFCLYSFRQYCGSSVFTAAMFLAVLQMSFSKAVSLLMRQPLQQVRHQLRLLPRHFWIVSL